MSAENFSSIKGSPDGVIKPNPQGFSHLNFNNLAAGDLLATANTPMMPGEKNGVADPFEQAKLSTQTTAERQAMLKALTSIDGNRVLASNGFAPAKIITGPNGQPTAIEFSGTDMSHKLVDKTYSLPPTTDAVPGNTSDKFFQQFVAAAQKYTTGNYKTENTNFTALEAVRDVLAKESPEQQSSTLATTESPEGQAYMAQRGLTFNVPQADSSGRPTWIVMQNTKGGGFKVPIPDAGVYSASWSKQQVNSLESMVGTIDVEVGGGGAGGGGGEQHSGGGGGDNGFKEGQTVVFPDGSLGEVDDPGSGNVPPVVSRLP